MTDATPPWLLTMRAITGLTETPGSGDNPKILAMRDALAAAYPEQAAYWATYQHDSTAWCGLAGAYCMMVAGIRPVWGPADTDRPLWAKAWRNLNWGYQLNVPRLGAVVVMTRGDGGHVTFWERTEGTNYLCRGGNQSDSVNLSSFPIANVIGLMWPKAAGVPAIEGPRRELKLGDSGSDVVYLQTSLGVPADGDFGPVTDAQVRAFQSASGLEVDGEVGPQTWARVDEIVKRKAAGDDGISKELASEISTLAHGHSIQTHSWADRGHSPPGYIAGLGQCFALALLHLQAGDPAAREMAMPLASPDTDALAWYAQELRYAQDLPGINRLHNLFVLMIGLGMRESSGKYCEGRDMSATNTTADSAEAGLFQTSWDIRSASPQIPPLLENFIGNPNGFLPAFAEGINPTADNLACAGTGQGVMYQWLSKYAPAFHTFVTAIGLRRRRNHWGPINRKEAEIVPAADDYLRQVAALVAAAPPVPMPEPPTPPLPEGAVVSIDIAIKGEAHVFINGRPYAP